MAKIKLPFGLERNNGEPVVETTEIDHNGQPLDEVLEGVSGTTIIEVSNLQDVSETTDVVLSGTLPKTAGEIKALVDEGKRVVIKAAFNGNGVGTLYGEVKGTDEDDRLLVNFFTGTMYYNPVILGSGLIAGNNITIFFVHGATTEKVEQLESELGEFVRVVTLEEHRDGQPIEIAHLEGSTIKTNPFILVYDGMQANHCRINVRYRFDCFYHGVDDYDKYAYQWSILKVDNSVEGVASFIFLGFLVKTPVSTILQNTKGGNVTTLDDKTAQEWADIILPLFNEDLREKVTQIGLEVGELSTQVEEGVTASAESALQAQTSAQNAQVSASVAASKLATIQEQIEQMTTPEGEIITEIVVANVADNKAKLSELRRDLGGKLDKVSVEKEYVKQEPTETKEEYYVKYSNGAFIYAGSYFNSCEYEVGADIEYFISGRTAYGDLGCLGAWLDAEKVIIGEAIMPCNIEANKNKVVSRLKAVSPSNAVYLRIQGYYPTSAILEKLEVKKTTDNQELINDLPKAIEDVSGMKEIVYKDGEITKYTELTAGLLNDKGVVVSGGRKVSGFVSTGGAKTARMKVLNATSKSYVAVAFYDESKSLIRTVQGDMSGEVKEATFDCADACYIRYMTNGNNSSVTFAKTTSIKDDVKELKKKKINVLEIGSSLNRCSVASFPFIASKNEIEVTFATLFVGSMTLQQIADGFTNGTIFYDIKMFKAGDVATISRTIPNLLKLERWDYVIIGRGAGEDTTFSKDQETYLQAIVDGITENAVNNPTILFNIGIPSGRSGMDSMEPEWQAQVNTAKDMQSKFGVDLLPIGTAVTNARRTSLANLGAYHMAESEPSGMRIDSEHLDWGIGYYVCGATLYEYIMSKNGSSVLTAKGYASFEEQSKIRIASGAGLSAEQCYTEPTTETMRIAKVCAMLAVKNPYELSDAVGTRFPIQP